MYVRLRKYDAEMLLPSIPLAVTQEPERVMVIFKLIIHFGKVENQLYNTSEKSNRTLP